MESRNREMKNPCLKAGSSVITEGSQEEAENKALEESRLRDSTQISEQKDSQIKEAKEITEKVEKDVKNEEYVCKRYCRSPDLNMKEPRIIFSLLKKKKKKKH